MAHSYTRNELTEYFFEALDMFNDCLDSDISKENVLLEFFTPENGVAVYESFCRDHFPKLLEEPYKEEGYFESFGAQAFVNETEYGVLIREDINFTLGGVLQMFLHEISHLYCTKNEIDGGGFFDKYCMGSGPEDGMMNAGYAIWREAVADIMADSIISEYATTTLSAIKKFVKEYKDKYDEVPNQFAADAYDAIYAIKAAMEEAKVTPDMSVTDMGDALKSAMTKVTIDGLTGDKMSWSDSGEVNKDPKAVVIENGEYVGM